MALFHISDRPGIEVFEPHVAATSAIRDQALVWAIDDWHQCMYFVPRDCPRACFWPGDETTGDDRARFFAGSGARMVIAVETAWLGRIRDGVLYRYTMPEEPFTAMDANAGHWVSREAVAPLACERLEDLLGSLAASGVELRVMPSLIELWREVIQSSMQFSGTRLRNAAGWSEVNWGSVPLGVYAQRR